MKADIAWGTITEALALGLEDLLIFHWTEVEHHQAAMPLAVDWPKYLMLERAGIYRPILARLNGKLIGYNAFFVQPPLHHAQVWAINDVLYIDPDHRKGTAGRDLITQSEAMLAAAGAKLISYGDRRVGVSTDAKPRATLGSLLLRLGYGPVESVYAKLL